ncbi:hypothetical protein, partial [Xanthomonas graminis]|uniref:hypothetical protein n=1 Tax=Xanthomonas graminis TaxID=3390026 RepID=UPI000AD8CEB3
MPPRLSVRQRVRYEGDAIAVAMTGGPPPSALLSASSREALLWLWLWLWRLRLLWLLLLTYWVPFPSDGHGGEKPAG